MAEVTWDALLNNFTKELYSGIIVAENMIDDVPLLKALEANVDRANFDANGNVKVLMQTQRARNARGVEDGGNLPTARAGAFIEQTIDVFRIMALAGLTEKVAKLLTGGLASWGKYAARALDDCILDWKNVANIACHSNGTGALAEADGTVTYTKAGVGDTYDDCDTAIITCDNTYSTSGIENTSLIQKDMYVSIWDASANGGVGAFMTDGGGTGATEWRVSAVAPGKRSSATYAGTTGTVTIAGISTGLSAAIADGDIIFLPGTRTAITDRLLPMGLTGIIANNNSGTYDDEFTSPFNLATFQGLTRATYSSLQSDVWKATDFGQTTDGTVDEWDLSVISDAMDEVIQRGGKTRLIRCHPNMARTMHRLNRSDQKVNIVISRTEQQDQAIIGDMKPKYFLDIEGDLLPIIADRWCPRYVVEGLDTSVLRWHPVGNADWRQDLGSIWGPKRGGRATAIEAAYEWWYELSSERCDWHWRMQDLRIDL